VKTICRKSRRSGAPSIAARRAAQGLHRIRHYGLLANGNRAANLSRMRELLDVAVPEPEPCDTGGATSPEPRFPPCPCCGGRMRLTPIVEAGFIPPTSPAPPTVIRIDTS
jgi:hypothetical protein